jgi:hypothetical protein
MEGDHQVHLGGVVASALLLWLLMAAGITQPGGAGTTIFIYDDTAGGPYPFAGLAATFPADFIDLGVIGSSASYRSKVDVQLGDTGVGTATTTLIDNVNSSVHFDLGKTLKNRATQTTSWNYQLGSKIGSGNIAAGSRGTNLLFGAATTLTGNHSWYGCLVRATSGALSFNVATDGVGEMVSCLLQSIDSAGTKPINIGNATNRFANVYNVHFSHNTAAQISSNFGALASERVSWGGTPSRFWTINTGNLAPKDALFIGTPSSADIAWGGTSALAWRLYRPTFSGNAPKFVPVTSGFPPLDGTNETWELRRATFKIVDRNGAGVSAIPFSLTDQFGTSIVSGTSDSNGNILFGSGAAAQMVPVMDHYAVGAVYTQRHRSPFTIKTNMPDMAGYNSNYLSRSYKFRWPGYESVTTSAGQFEDLGEIIAVENQSGAPTMWDEVAVP